MDARARPPLLLALSLTLGCEPTRAPPPLPIAPAPLPSAPAVALTSPDEGAQHHAPPARTREPKSRSALPRKTAERPTTQASSTPKPARPARPLVQGPSPARGPSPTPPPPQPARVVPTRVIVPSTAHVRAEIPSGLQQDLDADPRMQPFLERVIAIADGCHARNRDAHGTLQALLTMHADARPDADLRMVPPSLAAVVACATGSLLRLKMPLFTGREGVRYTVRLHFE